MNLFFDRNGFLMESIVFISLFGLSSHSAPGAVSPPMFTLQLFNGCDESNCYTKVSNLNYSKMWRSNSFPSLSIGKFNLRFRLEFMCDKRNCVMEVKDPYNRVIISNGNRETTNNEFTAILGFPNSCNHTVCQVIVFNMLHWNNKIINEKTLKATQAQDSGLNVCGFNFDFSHSCDDINCILEVSNSRGDFISVNMIKSDVPNSDGEKEIMGFVIIILGAAFVIYLIKVAYSHRLIIA